MGVFFDTRTSRTENGVVTCRRVSTRCGRNRVERSVAYCEMSEMGSQWPLERRGMSPGCAKSAERSGIVPNLADVFVFNLTLGEI